jgi:homoisocitrate dehydrogenase
MIHSLAGKVEMAQRRLRIALIPGDGIGCEVIPAARAVLDTAGVACDYVALEAGFDRFLREGDALPQATVDAVRGCDGALFGAVSSPSRHTPGYASPILTLRKELDLFANLRPVASLPPVGNRPSRDFLPEIDFVIVRENTECLYVKRERVEEGGARVIAERVITQAASARIAVKACELAVQRAALRPGRRPRLTIVHKANVLSLSDGLFRNTALAVASGYPDIEVEEQLVDSMVYRMIREPQRYDVVVAPNLYGDILSDAAAALVGGLGVAPSANVGDGYVLAEPVHGSAPDLAGKGVANPVAAIRAAGLLIAELGMGATAQRVEQAVRATLALGLATPDLGGTATTATMTAAICAALARQPVSDGEPCPR